METATVMLRLTWETTPITQQLISLNAMVGNLILEFQLKYSLEDKDKMLLFKEIIILMGLGKKKSLGRLWWIIIKGLVLIQLRKTISRGSLAEKGQTFENHKIFCKEIPIHLKRVKGKFWCKCKWTTEEL